MLPRLGAFRTADPADDQAHLPAPARVGGVNVSKEHLDKLDLLHLAKGLVGRFSECFAITSRVTLYPPKLQSGGHRCVH